MKWALFCHKKFLCYKSIFTFSWYSQHLDNNTKDDVPNGRTAVNIPGDTASPKAMKSPTSLQSDKRNMLRVEQTSHSPQHREQNSSKVGNHHNNNLNRTNSACLNNLILPLLSDVRLKDNFTKDQWIYIYFLILDYEHASHYSQQSQQQW